MLTPTLPNSNSARLPRDPDALLSLSSGVVLFDDEGVIQRVNTAFERFSGYLAAELVGHLAPVLRSGLHGATLLATIRQTVQEQGLWQGQLWSRHKSGRLLRELVTICRQVQPNGPLVALLNLQERAPGESEAPVLEARLLDPLTGLLDRPGFYGEVEALCQQGIPFALLSLDLDDFRQINTQLDHQTGDLLLQRLAERLRQLAGSQLPVGRVGGDGFALLLPGVTQEAELASWVASVLELVRRPFAVGPRKLRLSATLGGALWPLDGQSSADLLRHTDQALFEARRQKRAYLCFSANMMAHLARRETLSRGLQLAITEGEITLAYQPIWDNRVGRVAKLEALARWEHPELGVISPLDFIPLAEESGLIQTLGELLLAQACRDLRQLHQLGYGWLQMSVNRSTLEFNTLSLDGREWLQTIRAHGLEPQHIIFEITESLFMTQPEEQGARLRALRQAGCQIAIDDFGTGFSALNYLRLYPLDLVKIDRSFVSQIPEHHQDTLLLQGLFSIVHNLGMQLVTEGIEREAQQEFVCRHGCAYTQGYLFSRPLALSALLAYLAPLSPQQGNAVGQSLPPM